MEEKEKHIAALDGVRGIAILLVLLVHFIPPIAMPWRVSEWFMKIFSTGGWAGVDLFFVLSGFLITGILLRTKDQPHYFINFYMRRTLRIFPLYFAALAIIFIILPYFVETPSFAAARENQIYFWTYLANVAVFKFGFDGVDSDIVFPSAYWSLAVEEHFYLIWPAAVYFLSSRAIRATCISIIIGALIIRCCGLLLYGANSPFFYLTPCRMDSLAAGALVAVVLYERGEAGMQRMIGPVAIAALAAATGLTMFFLYTKGLWAGHWFMRTLGLTLLAGVFATIPFFVVAIPRGLLAGILSTAPLTFFGKYSYGLYVIHAMLPTALAEYLPTAEWMARFGEHVMIGSLSLAAAKIAICTPLAMLSYHLFEIRFLRMKRYFESSGTATKRWTMRWPNRLADEQR